MPRLLLIIRIKQKRLVISSRVGKFFNKTIQMLTMMHGIALTSWLLTRGSTKSTSKSLQKMVTSLKFSIFGHPKSQVLAPQSFSSNTVFSAVLTTGSIIKRNLLLTKLHMPVMTSG